MIKGERSVYRRHAAPINPASVAKTEAEPSHLTREKGRVKEDLSFSMEADIVQCVHYYGHRLGVRLAPSR